MGSYSSSGSVGRESGVYCHRLSFCWHSNVSSKVPFCLTWSLSHQEKFLWLPSDHDSWEMFCGDSELSWAVDYGLWQVGAIQEGYDWMFGWGMGGRQAL